MYLNRVCGHVSYENRVRPERAEFVSKSYRIPFAEAELIWGWEFDTVSHTIQAWLGWGELKSFRNRNTFPLVGLDLGFMEYDLDLSVDTTSIRTRDGLGWPQGNHGMFAGVDTIAETNITIPVRLS